MVVGGVEGFFLLSERGLVGGGGLVRAAVVFLLGGVRGPGALALFVAPDVHILADLFVSDRAAGWLAS